MDIFSCACVFWRERPPTASYVRLRPLQEWAAQSVLGRSGFLAAFALIFLSEIGDKTFFLAALLAMKVLGNSSYRHYHSASHMMSVLLVVLRTLQHASCVSKQRFACEGLAAIRASLWPHSNSV